MAAVASRYARAMVDVVLDDKIDPTIAIQQVNDMATAVAESNQLRKVWESPAVPAEQKRALLDAIVARAGTIRPIRNFFAILIDHGRIPMVAQIARQFETELNTQLGFVEADVTSSRQLSDVEKRDLEAQVASITGKKVRAKYDTNPELLGGALVRVGSTIYDGSVRGQLQRLKEQLASS
ncbi:MAG TPA: ATP synthase F1 subunit delta [Terriglobales bacterium]